MPLSKCVRCNDTRFEVVEANVRGIDRPLAFVQCAGCGAVVSAIEAVKPAADAKVKVKVKVKPKPQQR